MSINEASSAEYQPSWPPAKGEALIRGGARMVRDLRQRERLQGLTNQQLVAEFLLDPTNMMLQFEICTRLDPGWEDRDGVPADVE